MRKIKKLGFILVVTLILAAGFFVYKNALALGGQGTATIDGGAPGGNVSVTIATSHKFTVVLTIGVSGITANAQNPTFTIPAGFTAPNPTPVANAELVDADGKWSVSSTAASNGGSCTVNTPDAGLTIASGQVITVDVTTTCANGFTPPDSITLTYQGQSSITMVAAPLNIGTAVDFNAGPVTPISAPPTITVNDVVPPPPATLHVIKHVITDNGGTAVASAWILTVASSNGGTGIGNAVGVESPGTTYTLQAGKDYSVVESGGPSGYGATLSSDCTIANAVTGATYNCTITNDDIASQLTVTKTVVNTGGGTKAVVDFPLLIDGIGVTSGVASTTTIGAHMISETSNSNYTSLIGGDCATNGTITLAAGAVKACTITNTYIPPVPTSATLTVTKTVVNTGGGTKAVVDFPLLIDGIGVTSGVASTTTIGAHIISETSNSNYTSLIGGDCATNGTITLAAGAVKACTITNTYIPPVPTSATLHIIKHVMNDNGGSATATNFTIHVAGTNVSNLSFTGSEAGVDITLDAGSYSVTEPVVPTGYLESGSGGCSGTIAAGETKTCTITNDDVAPKLIVNKIVVNDNGGTKVIADFLLFVDGGSVTSGVASTTTIGVHTVSETFDSGYAATIGGNCAANGTITLALGDVKTCTIINDDIARLSSGGGNYSYVSPVPPLIDVVKVPSPLILPTGPGSVTYTYTLRNIGMVPVTNITMVDDTCSPLVRVSGDTNGDNRLDVAETWGYTCSTTLAKTHTNIVTTIGWANGISAIDIASAQVIVGIPVVPPLIHVTKIPSSLTLPSGGAMIVYNNKVTNPGTVPLSNVRLTDDKCDPVKYISGDTNNDSKLDTAETWTYTCQTKLIKTTVNTVTASGEANSLTAKDFAIATVVVAPIVPKLPNTGVAPENNSAFENIVLFFGLLMLVSISVVIVLKKRKT